jgi:hypothetical protein
MGQIEMGQIETGLTAAGSPNSSQQSYRSGAHRANDAFNDNDAQGVTTSAAAAGFAAEGMLRSTH